jgi:type VI secretion system protein ImpA
MAAIDISSLLQEISPEAPCGEDLEYDPAFQEMDRASQTKPEQQIGDSIIPAEEPNWKDLKARSLDVLGRSKDIRAAVFLTRSLTHMDGFPGLADGLELIRGMHEQFWDTFHPQLDPDDYNDPTMRINAILSLCDVQGMIASLRSAPLVSSRILGTFGLLDILASTGEISPPAGQEAPDPTHIDAAFQECEVEHIQEISEAVTRAIDHTRSTEATLTELVGAAQAPSLEPLVSALIQAQTVLAERLARRGIVTATDGQADAAEGGQGAAAAAPQPAAGEINSREDALRMMEKISDYFLKNEPSSPVPLLLQRARRLVSRSFMEILQDMAPSGLTEAQNVSGVEPEQPQY